MLNHSHRPHGPFKLGKLNSFINVFLHYDVSIHFFFNSLRVLSLLKSYVHKQAGISPRSHSLLSPHQSPVSSYVCMCAYECVRVSERVLKNAEWLSGHEGNKVLK